MKLLHLLLGVGFVISGCSGGGRAPSSPSPVVPSPATGTIFGLIVATGPTGAAPLEGVRVGLAIGAQRLSTVTDGGGTYVLNGVSQGDGILTADKEGYDTSTRPVSVEGEIRVDVGLVRSPSFTMSGVISEATASGLAPLEGVLVTGAWDYPVHTGPDGAYLVPVPVYQGQRLSFFASKDGFTTARRDIVIDGNTILDVTLARQ